MTRIFLSSLLGLLLYVPVTSLSASQETKLSTPVQVVAAFQKIPHYETFCMSDWGGGWEPVKVGAKFDVYLSKELHKLFLWSQCRYPDIPPFYADLHNLITWEIRFGYGYGGQDDMEENIRVQKAKLQSADKATVKVLYDFGTLKNLVTTYTLIREDGHWKIDDIAPKGDYVEESDQEPFLEHSDSIKTDMQNNYRAAEKRYQEEQAKKH